MCGILAILGAVTRKTCPTGYTVEDLRKRAVQMATTLRHRGPDASGVWVDGDLGVALAHERLSIVDPMSGRQPLFARDGQFVLTVNGEIYDHEDLKTGLREPFPFSTASDCEVILPLYLEHGADCVKMLHGMFAFVLVDREAGTFLVARDHMGIVPLYYGWGADGSLVIASELKALAGHCTRFHEFPPGHTLTGSLSGVIGITTVASTSGLSEVESGAGGAAAAAAAAAAASEEPKSISEEAVLRAWYQPKWHDEHHIPSSPADLAKLRAGLEAAVERRLMADVPWGVLLSGGLDSSLVASIASKIVKRRAVAAHGPSAAETAQITTFSIGLEGSPDLAAAQRVADFIGSKHYSFTFSVQEGLDALTDAVYKLETFDITTIRAGIPMYLLSRIIKSMGIKMVLSGEGADEMFGGYLYFHHAPSKEDFHSECVRKLKDLHSFDCLRANKATSAWGLEARVPFLDRDFLDFVMDMDPAAKMCSSSHMEKHVLRLAFDDKEDPYLPHDVLWRQKEQFSDGVGYSWIDGLRDNAAREVTDRMLKAARYVFPESPPTTKEGYYLRSIFEGHFPQDSARQTVPTGPSIACSTSVAIAWTEAFKQLAMATNGDCSGRAVSGVHVAAYDNVEEVVKGHKSA